MRLRRWSLLVIALVAIAASVRLLIPRLLFRGWGAIPAPVPPDVRRFVAWSADGAPVHAIEIDRPGAPVVLHFHDNRQTVADTLPFARALHARGLSVVAMEYRGYGTSSALVPSEEALYRDAEAVLGVLRGRGVRVMLSGRSLGTGVAAEMARRGHGTSLLLVAPYTSIPELIPLAPRFLLADRFETASKAASIGIPTLIVHGDADEIVPFSMGETLVRLIPHARLLKVRGARHGDPLDEGAISAIAAIAN